jgi:hypothetical protein
MSLQFGSEVLGLMVRIVKALISSLSKRRIGYWVDDNEQMLNVIA